MRPASVGDVNAARGDADSTGPAVRPQHVASNRARGPLGCQDPSRTSAAETDAIDRRLDTGTEQLDDGDHPPAPSRSPAGVPRRRRAAAVSAVPFIGMKVIQKRRGCASPGKSQRVAAGDVAIGFQRARHRLQHRYSEGIGPARERVCGRATRNQPRREPLRTTPTGQVPWHENRLAAREFVGCVRSSSMHWNIRAAYRGEKAARR